MTKRKLKPKKPQVKKVTLPKAGVVQVVVPKDVVPIVAQGDGVVEIVPVKKTKKRWWQVFP